MALTIEDARARVETSLEDDVLTRILANAEQSVARSAGNAATETETHHALGAGYIVLSRRSVSVTEIVERRSLYGDPVTLAANDYRKVGDYRLLRLSNGTNPAGSWGAEVIVTYVPEVDQELRDRVVLDLVQVDVEFRAFEREEIGDWEGEQKDYRARRRELLAQVREGRSPIL